MKIVVNEWLLDYICPGIDLKKISMADQFISGLLKKCDKIVIGRATPFVKKFYHHMKKFGSDTDFKRRSTKLNELFFRNLDKTIILDDVNIEKVPKEIEEKAPADDKYLIKLAYSSEDKIIVTTDQRLKDKLQDEVDIKIYLLPEFLAEYLSQK